ncbi:MAG: hypothetical protein TE42_08805 [Candidatus Synechococcus spongiarum SP3]|uniref:Uncharacterized protein n=1 Tax=Candidatus Synechococcus spongiarum SP3 TaxID=1604020 RepID=A0A0G2IVP9_9SYNE|nr:MAG: hypothetical protein TE42_08805 [Candidatus Synechococcus spongiarum SP3]
MSELSKRLEELMARMARTDARLFRTIGEQNAALHRIAEDMQPPEETPAVLTDQEGKPSTAALAAASLLPREQCTEKELRKRFRTLGQARAFLEKRLGVPPKGAKRITTWALVQQTVTTGQWPAGKPSGSQGGKSGGTAMAAIEQRLQPRLERLEPRLERLEVLLLQVLEQQSGAIAPPPP